MDCVVELFECCGVVFVYDEVDLFFYDVLVFGYELYLVIDVVFDLVCDDWLVGEVGFDVFECDVVYDVGD